MTDILAITVNYFAYFLQMAIFARAISTWLPISRDNFIVRLLYMLTEPVVAPIRAAMRKSPLGGPGMMIDFSPVIAMMLIMLARTILINLLLR